MLIAARNGFMAGKRLPYDAEVEYLESTGTQYVDTGVMYNVNNTYIIANDITYMQVMSPPQGSGWDAGGQNSVDTLGCIRVANLIGPMCIGKKVVLTQTINSGFDTLTEYVYDIEGTSWSASRNHTSLAQYAANFGYGIFAIASTTDYKYFAYVRCRKYKIVVNNVLVRDYIPVRVGTTGAMYDKRGVGGMNPDGTARNDGMYFNRGTGDFGYGNDK